MPDISKCAGQGCPLKECCYRYTSRNSPFWQYTEKTPPYNAETKTCDLFWCAEGKEEDFKKIRAELDSIAEPPLEESDINPIS